MFCFQRVRLVIFKGVLSSSSPGFLNVFQKNVLWTLAAFLLFLESQCFEFLSTLHICWLYCILIFMFSHEVLFWVLCLYCIPWVFYVFLPPLCSCVGFSPISEFCLLSFCVSLVVISQCLVFLVLLIWVLFWVVRLYSIHSFHYHVSPVFCLYLVIVCMWFQV